MPSSIKGFEMIGPQEVAAAHAARVADRAVVQQKFERAVEAGEYARSITPIVITNALAIAVLSYFKVFTLLSFLNIKVATYAVPAAASQVAGYAAKAPVWGPFSSAAAVITRKVVEYRTISAHEQSIA